jgi:hypothetical protein
MVESAGPATLWRGGGVPTMGMSRSIQDAIVNGTLAAFDFNGITRLS